MGNSLLRKNWWAALLITTLLAAACGDDDGVAAGGGCDGEIPEDSAIEIWWHEGAEAEVKAVESFVEDFNSSQDQVAAELTLIPEADYGSTLSGAAASDELPDVVDTDASFAFNFAWSRDLQPIENCIPDDIKNDLLPSIVDQGTYADQIWAVGMFDSGLGLYADRSALEEVGARIPSGPDDAWTVEEFDQILSDLQDAGYQRPLDLKKNYGQGEYYSYGFAPIVWSSGGDLINRDDFQDADGALNSDATVEALTAFQSWFENGYVDDNTDDAAFVEGRSPISWVGHWEYNRYKEAMGDKLVALPLPDFGEGTATGQGSWQWAIGSNAEDPDAAWAWIEFTLQPEQQEAMAEASGAIPSRSSVAESTEKFGSGGDLEIYVTQHEQDVSVPRPPHPSYPTISSAFNQAIQTIIDGGDVKGALDQAVSEINSDIEDNEGYPPPE
jgi:multiple sugar transport system substrate-binding protein